ncbi:MAG: glutamate-cysteine ligase family protein [Desulfuromonadales bacterium]|nr:glutamate-cysteine ligase family protein [Desulfuromonadales bacterium]
MNTLQKPGLATPLTSDEQLLDYFRAGARPAEDWGIGLEMEQLAVDAASGEAAGFDRIELLLQELAAETGWQPMVEAGRTIGLRGPQSSITLEPGGQVELSGQLCPDLCCNESDFIRHVNSLVRVGNRLGLAFLGLGTQPFTPLDAIAWIPKARYGIMGPYMLRTGDMGQRMMKQSAGVQVNLDYSDEADCMAKLRLSQALAPLLYSLFANSPLLDGKPSGFLSTRGEIWARTDPDRTGLLPFLFADRAGFADYVDYALDVPMYFLIREGRFVDLTGERFPFRRFLHDGFAGHRPTLSDWDTHLSTLFPEVRLRPQIEIRSVDSLPPTLALTVAALLKGLLYDREAREAAWQLCRPDSADGLWRSCQDAWRLGLRAPWRDGSLLDLAHACVELACKGLRRESARRGQAVNESLFLHGLVHLVDGGVTLAEQLLGNWQGGREARVQALISHCGFAATEPRAPAGGCR